MQYKTLGNTGLKVSVIGFGGALIGLEGHAGAEVGDVDSLLAEANTAIRQAIARGINYFDTFPEFGDGRSERILGQIMEGHRNRVLLATRYPCDPSLTPAKLTENLHASLDRLRTSYVDSLLLHGSYFTDKQAQAVAESGILDWADEMQAKGLCRFTGITADTPSGALERLLKTWRFDIIQVGYSVVQQSMCGYHQHEPVGIVPLARSLGMGIIAMRADTSGFLQRLLKSEFPDIETDRLTRLAVNFAISTSEVDCALVGMRTAAEVNANCDLANDLAGRIDIRALHDRYA